MKVLQITPNLVPNGAQTVCVELARCLRSETEVHVASLYSRGGSPLEDTLDRSRIPLWDLGKSPGIDLNIVGRLMQLVRRIRPDVIHTHMNALQYVLLAAKIEAIPVLIHTVHTAANMETIRLGRMLNSIAFRSGVVPVAVAGAVRETLAEKYLLQNVAVIPNGICVSECDWTMHERSECRRENDLSEETLLFITLARIDPVKGIDVLLNSFKNLRSQNRAAALWIVGDGPLRSHFEQTMRGLDNVRFLGPRNDRRRLLAAADVFVLPSRYEASPLALMEAMAAGKPVIATAVGGIPEIVREGQDGLLIPAESEESLTQAMIRLAEDHDARTEMGKNGFEWARQQFTSRRMTAEYMDLYRRMLEKKAPLKSTRNVLQANPTRQ